MYGLAGFCAGPLLGSVLTVSAAGGSAAYGGLLMGVYALGMAVPLFVMSLIWDRLHLSRRRWLRGRTVRIGPLTTHTTNLISGVLFAGIGALFLTTDGTANIGGFSGVDTQYNLQSWLQTVAGPVDDAGVLLVAAVTVLLVLLLRITFIARRTRQNLTDGSGRGRQADPTFPDPTQPRI